MIEKMKICLDSKRIAGALLTDLSKAFKRKKLELMYVKITLYVSCGMFHSGKSNNSINIIHKRTLRTVYNDSLLSKSSYVKITLYVFTTETSKLQLPKFLKSNKVYPQK